jgi:hypothetical protein
MGLYDAYNKGKTQGFNKAQAMQTAYDNLIAVREEKARQVRQEQEQKAKQQFDYYGKILSNTDMRLGLSDKDEARLLGEYKSVGSVIGVDAVDPNPIDQAMSVEVFKLRTDPQWLRVPPAERLRYLKNRYGRRFYSLRSQFRDMAVLQGQAETVPQPNVSSSTAGVKESAQTQESGASLMQPGNGYINTLPGAEPTGQATGQIENASIPVPMPVQKTPEELEAEALFPEYEPVLTLAEQRKEWDDAYDRALINSTRGKGDPSYIKNLLDRGAELGRMEPPRDDSGNILRHPSGNGYAWPQETIDDFRVPVIDPMKQRQEQLKQFDNFKKAIREGGENVRADVVATAYAYGLPDPLINALNTMPIITPEKAAGLQNKDEDQELAKTRLETQNLVNEARLAISKGNMELAAERLNLAEERLNWQQHNSGSGGKSAKAGKQDFWLREQPAIDAALDNKTKAMAQQDGFGTTAIMRGPARIQEFYGTANDPKSPYWHRDKKGVATAPTPAGLARIREIRESEEKKFKELKGSQGAVTVTPSAATDGKTSKAVWGTTYKPDQCGTYAKDFLKHNWDISINTIGSLPTVSKDSIKPLDIVYLGKAGNGTTNHYAVYLPNGKLSELITSKGKPYISETRTLASVKPRIQKVYRASQKQVSNAKQSATSNNPLIKHARS